jgi:hypothetical protein
VTAAFNASLLQLFSFATRNAIALELRTIGSESLVTRARNELVAAFMATDCTHLVFIDADIEFRIDDFLRLYAGQKDVMAGTYPRKSLDWERIRRHVLAEPGCDPSSIPLAGANYVINIAYKDQQHLLVKEMRAAHPHIGKAPGL